MTRASRRVIVGVLLGLAVFAGFSIYADTGKVADRLGGYAWWTFGAALGLALLNYSLRFFRWQLYLQDRDIDVPTGLSAQIFVGGFALSVTPGKVGELLKSYLLRATRGVSVARSAPIVVAERVTDLISLLLLGIIGVALYGVARTTVVAGAAAVGVGLVILATPAISRRLIRAVTHPRPLRRWRERLLVFYQGLVELVRPRPLAWASAIGVLAWLAECVGFALVCSGFPGAEVPVGLAILIYASTTVAGALSFLPGGLLVTEAAMTMLLIQSSVGLDEPTAVAATILIRLATLWFAVLLGLGALVLLRRAGAKEPSRAGGDIDRVLDGNPAEEE